VLRLVNLALVIFFISGVIFVLLKLAVPPPAEQSLNNFDNVLSQSVGQIDSTTIELSGVNYVITWTKVDAEKVSLVPNFGDRQTSKEVFTKNDCRVLVSGGFYDTKSGENVPIGHFVSSRDKLSDFTKNRLFNGVLSINEFGTPRITRSVPEDPLVSAVQTGPLIKENNEVLLLTSDSTKRARRMLAAVTGENELVFMAVYSPGSTFAGPALSELPHVVSEFEDKSGLALADAINLDGGSASAFLADGFSLSEASLVGSFFCAK